MEFATNARAIGGFVRWMTRDIDSQRTDRPARVPLSGAQAAALLRIGGEPMREAERADSGTNGMIVGAAAHGATAHQAPTSRAAGRITLAVLGLAGFSVLVQANSEQVPPNAPQSSGLVGRVPDTGASHTHDTPQGHHKMLNKITGVTAAAVVGIAATVAGAQSGAVQWKVEDGGNGHWYARNSQPMTWAQATASATTIGGALATTTTQLELDFVRLHLITDGTVCWLGGTIDCSGANDVCCTNCVWRWSNGETFDLSWYGWNPDNGYTTERLVTNGTTFDDMCSPCSVQDFRPPSIIEWSADCNSDGIVDYGQCHDGTLADYNGNNIPDCCETQSPCTVGRYPVQWRTSEGGNGHWYLGVRFDQTGASWTQAREDAIARGGDLVSLNTLIEREWVFNRVSRNPALWTTTLGPWVGGLQPAGSPEPAGGWMWVDGTPVYEGFYWNDYHPDGNNNCGGAANRMTYWGNYTQGIGDLFADCADRTRFQCWNIDFGNHPSSVIEWSTDCNNDNIVDYGQILTGQLADSNTNGIPDICEQPQCQDADITNNHIIDGADLGALLAFWGPVNPVLPQADINRDGEIDGSDLGILLSFWGPCP